MAENWVLNASPLIVLARIGQASLFNQLADKVVIPQVVVTEIGAGPVDDEARRFLAGGHLLVVSVSPPNPQIVAWDLGIGETAVLTYAIANPGWTAILDDGVARKCARSFSIPHKGTLAVVLLAKQKGLIPSAADTLRALQSRGFRLDDDMVREALYRTVGEKWEQP